MKKILIIENSPTIISVADSLLRQQGYDVTCLSEGKKAFEFAKQEKPDLILSSLSLSDIDGIQLCKKITEEPIIGSIPVVLMVSDKDSNLLDKIEESGARAKINKPFSPKELLVIVEKFVGGGKSTTKSTLVDQTTKGVPKLKPRVAPSEIGTATRSVLEKQVKADAKKPETVFNLDWSDLEGEVDEMAKAASKNETDDTGLILEEDQFGLTSLNDEVVSFQDQPKEEDYEWFVKSMKDKDDDGILNQKNHPSPNTAKPTGSAQQKPANKISKDDTKYRQFIEQFKQEKDTIVEDKPATESKIDMNMIVESIASKLARKVVENLDKQELKQLITSILKEQK